MIACKCLLKAVEEHTKCADIKTCRPNEARMRWAGMVKTAEAGTVCGGGTWGGAEKVRSV